MNRSLPELAGKRMALSFTPATPADEETLASFIPPDAADLPTSLPAGVIDLIAEYSIDGVTVARGGTYGLGYTVNTRQRLFEPGTGWREIDNTLAAGDYQAGGWMCRASVLPKPPRSRIDWKRPKQNSTASNSPA